MLEHSPVRGDGFRRPADRAHGATDGRFGATGQYDTAGETMTGPQRIGVLIIDDHPIVQSGYRMILEAAGDFEICGFASTEAEALQAVSRLHPDVAIVDLMLGEQSGLALIDELRRIRPELKILVVTAHDEQLFAHRALKAGALGFLTKREAAAQLVAAVRTVAAGDLALDSRLMRQILQSELRGRNSESAASPVDRLSDRELHVFRLIGEGLTTRQIAEALFISPRTVERFRENIKQKLGISNAVELVHTATVWVLQQGR
ncbi:MAG: DNA-binding response regulator [Planctomycetota bacterium]|nr:MAG: DNA-binding response regulator [Planctomycetota bacterium]